MEVSRRCLPLAPGGYLHARPAGFRGKYGEEPLTSSPVADESEVLWHYTSPAGLHGILTTRSVYATNGRFLNDRDELQHGLGLCRSRVEQLKAENHPADGPILPRISYELSSMRDFDVFVFSLSSRTDDLPQWRAYTPASGGFSLGFDKAELESITKPFGFRICKCMYDWQSKEAELRRWIDSNFQNYRAGWAELNSRSANGGQHNSGSSVDPLVELASSFAPRILRGLYEIVATFKNEAFEHEDEWRLVSAPIKPGSAAVQHRSGRLGLVPYLDLRVAGPTGRLPIREIWVGPGADKDYSEAGLRAFRAGTGGAFVISVSTVPFRTT